MGRIVAIDYGKKRVGIAATDELQLIAGAVATLPPGEALAFVQRYAAAQKVDAVVVGLPLNLNGLPAEAAPGAQLFAARVKQLLPDVAVEMFDERFTSKLAMQAMIEAGVKKMARRNKALVDKVSACIILQSYMEHKRAVSTI
ncbi:MAG: Holliday junction resolvase RuvX [Prevotellaceae bacterium]|jgi:putative Holliday junction resolvase|nr:Holliday junction resolvase RuvX [Prevotellaceae bacterium]